jgi:hypothetical protein
VLSRQAARVGLQLGIADDGRGLGFEEIGGPLPTRACAQQVATLRRSGNFAAGRRARAIV